MSSETRQFLIKAFNRIGQGEDANKALGVTGKRGERRTREQALKRFNIRSDLAWIAAAIRPISEDGLGLTFQQAIDEIASDMNGGPGSRFTSETLKNSWNENPEWRTPTHSLPI